MANNSTIRKWQLRRRLENAVAETNSYLERNPEANANAALHANLSRAIQRNAFLERNNDDPPWRTDCYNELDGVTVYGTKTSNKLNTSLYKQNNNSFFNTSLNRTGFGSSAEEKQEKNFWNTPIDLSFKNPWPNARFSWFNNRVSGNPVYGDGSGSEEFGNQRGRNSVIGKSYDMSEWVTPGGGGGKLKFFAHKNNYTKHIVNLISHYITAKEHGDSVGDGVNKYKEPHFHEIKSDTTVTRIAFKVDTIFSDSKSFSTSKKKIKFSGSIPEVLKKIDSLERENEKQKWYLNWFKD